MMMVSRERSFSILHTETRIAKVCEICISESCRRLILNSSFNAQ